MDLPDKTSINKLSDEELTQAVQLLLKSDLWPDFHISRWEREFLPSIPEYYCRAGSFTWKQRSAVRQIVLKISEELARRHLILGTPP